MKSTVEISRTIAYVVVLAFGVLLLQFAMNSTAGPAQEVPPRKEYRMTEAMPDGIALYMLSLSVQGSGDGDPDLISSVQASTSLSESDAADLIRYVSHLHKAMKADFNNHAYPLACDSVNSRASDRRAAMTLNTLDDVRGATYERYFHVARAELTNAQFAGLQRWLKKFKKSAVYIELDHEARHKAKPSSDAMQALDNFCAGRGA